MNIAIPASSSELELAIEGHDLRVLRQARREGPDPRAGRGPGQVNLATERARSPSTDRRPASWWTPSGKIGYRPAPSPPRTITPNARPRPATPGPRLKQAFGISLA